LAPQGNPAPTRNSRAAKSKARVPVSTNQITHFEDTMTRQWSPSKKTHKFRTICPCPLSKCSTANAGTNKENCIPDCQLQPASTEKSASLRLGTAAEVMKP